MKRLIPFTLFLFCLLTLCDMTYAPDCSLPPDVNSGANQPSDEEEGEPVIYTLSGFQPMNTPHWKQVIMLEEDEALTSDMLRTHLIYASSNGGYAIKINWNLADDALNEPGLHYVTGTPILPDDAVLAEGFDGIASWPVFRAGDGAVLPALPEDPTVLKPMFALNGEPDTGTMVSTSDRCLVGSDGYIQPEEAIKWQWDFSQVDFTKAGIYTVTGTAVLPEPLVLAEEYEFSLQGYVLPTDRIEIYAFLGLTPIYNMEIEWLYDSSSVTGAVLETQTADGQWVACDADQYYFQTRYFPALLELSLLKFPVETEIPLRLRYTDVINGETVERTTQTIVLELPSNIADLLQSSPLYNITILEDDGNGDRDGSDSDGSELPDIVQPAPDDTTPDTDAEPQPEIPQEVVTDTYTAISGLRLNYLAGAGDTVLFEKQGVSAEIPSALLLSLNLSDYDLFEITILRPQPNAVQLSISAAGTALDSLTGTILYVPFEAPSDAALEALDINGISAADVSYDAAAGLARLEIAAPGTYVLTTSSTPEPESPEQADTGNQPQAESTLETTVSITKPTASEHSDGSASLTASTASTTPTPETSVIQETVADEEADSTPTTNSIIQIEETAETPASDEFPMVTLVAVIVAALFLSALILVLILRKRLHHE